MSFPVSARTGVAAVLGAALLVGSNVCAQEAASSPFNCASDAGVIVCQVAVPSITVVDIKLNRGACRSPLEIFEQYKSELRASGHGGENFRDFRQKYKLGDKFAIYLGNCALTEANISTDGPDYTVRFK